MIDCFMDCIKENKECLKCVITLSIVISAILFLEYYRCNIKGNNSTCNVFYKIGKKKWVSNAHNESPTSETNR